MSFRLRITVAAAVAVMAASVPLRAQFVLSQEDPASVRWSSVGSGAFRVIYPEGSDSLALVYLRDLEKFRPEAGRSLQMVSGQYWSPALDVVLHTRNSSSNGSVTWAPSRMELFTVPQWNRPTPFPWHTSLAVHEGRHAAQMQNGYRKVFKPFFYILGQVTPSLASAYPGSLLLEGDAVVAETALTASGRGRCGDFLEYYMYSLDNGDIRNWMRWRFGSYYRCTPNHYAFGYLLLSAIRIRYDSPLFMAGYFDYVARRPYDPWPLRHAMRRTTGLKFRESFSGIMDWHHGTWEEEALARGPFQTTEALSRPSRRLAEWSDPNVLPGGATVWVKKDIYHCPAITGIGSGGRECRIKAISFETGRVCAAPDGSLYWNELRKDPRWGQVRTSVIRRFDPVTRRVRKLNLPRGNYFQPAAFSGDTVTVIKYGEDSRSSLLLANGRTGETYARMWLPDSLQAVQTTALDGKIYVSAISDGGFGIWTVDGQETKAVLVPEPVSIFSLGNDGECITFGSDRDGVGEYYSLNPRTGVLKQLTHTRYGGTDFAKTPDGDAVFSQYNTNGTRPMVVKADGIRPGKTVEWSDIHHYPVADELSRQEKELARQEKALAATGEESPAVTSRRWRKADHAIRFHSWAPAYIDIDNVQDISFYNIQKTASLGAMGFFQNTLSTLSGYIGYKAAPASLLHPEGTWFHSGHLSITYSGLYPVFELQAHVGDRRPVDLWYNATRDTVFSATSLSRPRVDAGLRTYVPLSWNSGAWTFGLIPEMRFVYTNDRLEDTPNFDIHAGIRGYAMQNQPSACVYPRWGVGAEAQYLGNLSYFHIYGYVPGICCGQGLRLTSLYQMQSQGLSPFINSYVNLFPRGFTASSAQEGVKFTADYAIPFNMGDWHILDMFYCTRGIVTPHFDWSYFTYHGGNLFSAGASFEMEFGTFFWVKTPVRVGVSYSYNGGSLFVDASRHYVGALFKIDLPN